MANKVIQYRYYGEGNNKNYPVGAKYRAFVDGTVFTTVPFLQLGIQTLPGVRFALNSPEVTNEDSIVVGSTGIYQLSLNNKTEISELRFAAESMELIRDTASAYLIVDVVYEDYQEV